MIIEIPDEQIPAEHRVAILTGRIALVTFVAITPTGVPAVINFSPPRTDSRLLGLAIGLACNSITGMAERVASSLDLPQRIAFELAREMGQSERAMGDHYSEVRTRAVEPNTDPSL